ncbi:MAG: ABC transporter permease [Bacilli bacterium]|nr:ABC transporter permease [Bacilli bacterium]
MNAFKELYQYRELLKTNVRKDIRGKYKASFLGVLWSFVNPLLQVLVYAIVFPYIMKVQTDNYLIFLICGIIPWTWFTYSISNGTTSITNNANLIKKVYFPRVILPISVVTSGLVNFLISCFIILIFVLLGGVGLSWHLVFLPFIALIQYIITLAFTLLLSAINVYIKDVEYIIAFLINMLFYATPILYSTEIFHGSWLVWIFKLNPLAHLISAYRDIFYVHQVPQIFNLLILLLVGLLILIICYEIFKKLEKRFAEEV